LNRAYISCEFRERSEQRVHELLLFFQANDVLVEYAPDPGWDFYENIAAAIERCDVFVAIFLDGYRETTWLNVELSYALRLRETRTSLGGLVFPRPRMFGWKLSEPPGNYVTNQRLEWLSDDKTNWVAMLKPISKRQVENELFDNMKLE
jgi:hypothetical protein